MTCWSSTRPRPCPPRYPLGSRMAPRSSFASPPRRRGCPRTGGSSSFAAPTAARRTSAPEPVSALRLAGGATAVVVAPYAGGARLWLARFDADTGVEEYLARHGRPIRYAYASGDWPLDSYQTAYAIEPGSAEMPSAGRPFTPELVTALVARGSWSLRSPSTPGSRRPSATRPHTGALFGAARDGAAGQRRPRLGPPRGCRRNDGRAGARDRRRRPTASVRRSRGLDEPRDHAASAGYASSTA